MVLSIRRSFRYIIHYYHGQDIWNRLEISCKIAHYGNVFGKLVFMRCLDLSRNLDIFIFTPIDWRRNLAILIWVFSNFSQALSKVLVLLLTFTLHFTCGKRKSWLIIKKSQNIMTTLMTEFLLILYVFTNNSKC